MAAEWHYTKDGQQHGPVSASELKVIASSGTLLPTDMVRKEGMTEWKQASNVKGLFSPVHNVAAPALLTTQTTSSSQQSAPLKTETNSFIVRTNAINQQRPGAATVGDRTKKFWIYALASGAIAVDVISSIDTGRSLSFVNILLTVQHMFLQAIVPFAIVYRLYGSRQRTFANNRNTVLVGVVACVAVALSIQVFTGFFLAKFRLLTFIALISRVALAIVLIPKLPKKTERLLLPSLVLLFCGLQLFIATRSGWLVVSDLSAWTNDPGQLFRNTFSIAGKLMVAAAVFLYFRRRLATALNHSESSHPTGGLSTELQISPPPLTSTTGPAPYSAQKLWKKRILTAANGAAQYAAKQTERTKLVNLTLPSLYQSLGRHAFSSQAFREEFSELYQQLDQVQAELTKMKSRTPVEAKGFSDKAKAMAGQAMDAAQAQKLSFQQSSLFGTIGKSVYDKHGGVSEPQELVKPITEAVARLAMLDSELDVLSASKDGSPVTPKRLAIAVATAACVLVLLFLMPMRGVSTSYTQRILDLTAKQKKEFGVSVPKRARPLFAEGSAEDLIQSLTFFRYSGSLVSFDTTPTPYGKKQFGDTDELNGINKVYFVQYAGGMTIKKKCWEMIYGPQVDLKSVEEITPGDRRFGGGRSVLMDHWSVNCNDETLLVRGLSPKSPLAVNAKKDEIMLEFVHLDRPHEKISPKGRYMRNLRFEY